MTSKLVYTLDTTDETFRDEYAKAMVTAFLKAHGVDPKRFPVGNSIRVMRRESGGFQVRLWQTTSDKAPLCPSCELCLELEQVSVPLAAGVPLVAGHHVYADAPDDLPKAAPEDPVAAAESAYRAALSSLHMATENLSRQVRVRADQLAAAKGEPGSVVARLNNLGLLPADDVQEVAG